MLDQGKLMTGVCAMSLIVGMPALSEAQSTKVLEEYFANLQSSEFTLTVGDKADNARSTQWSNVTLKANDGKAQLVIPWIKVGKKILGGFDMTYAEKIEGAFQSPDPKLLEPIRFVIEGSDMRTEVKGEEGARVYASSFDEMRFRTLENNVINVGIDFSDGTSTQVFEAGDIGTSSGNFDVKTMVIEYGLEIDGQKMTSTSTITDVTSKFKVPLTHHYDPASPLTSFDLSRDMFLEYAIGSATLDGSIYSAMGPLEIKATYGAGSGAFGVKDSVVTLSGISNDINYDVTSVGTGMPPLQLNISNLVAKITAPLDNVDASKPAGIKIAINGLNLSDQVWALFDPKAILSREDINLDVDLSASLRWLKEMAGIDLNDAKQAPPVEVENAKINAFNLKVAGAELQTTGEVTLDNSHFPPIPEGTVNVSLKGAFGLLTKLTELGFVPAQNAMMIQGMSGMFFKPAGDGEDDLISVITMTKDGHISANGMPLK